DLIITYQITAPINAGFNPSHILTSANVTITVEEDEDEDEEIDVTYLLTNWAYIPGNDFVYTITVSNNGPDDAENVQITDLISNIPNIDINEVTWEGSNGTSGTGDLVDTVAVLEFGETITYTVVVPIPEDYDPTATIINTVEVTSDTSNDNNVCLGCTNYAAPMPLANLSILKDALTNCYLKDEWVVYEIIVTNAGPSTAYDVVIHDPIAPLYSTYGITYYNMTWEGTNGSAGTGTLNNTIDALNVGETVIYTLNIRIPETIDTTLNLTNRVYVSSSTPDPLPVLNNNPNNGFGQQMAVASITPCPNYVTITNNEYTAEELVTDVLVGMDRSEERRV